MYDYLEQDPEQYKKKCKVCPSAARGFITTWLDSKMMKTAPSNVQLRAQRAEITRDFQLMLFHPDLIGM